MQIDKRLVCSSLVVWFLVASVTSAVGEEIDVDETVKKALDDLEANDVDRAQIEGPESEQVVPKQPEVGLVEPEEVSHINSLSLKPEVNEPRLDNAKLDGLEQSDSEEPLENNFTFLKIFTGLYYQNTYSEINSYLVDHVEGSDVELNMAKALEWYNKEVAKKSVFNQAIVQALRQFTALSKISDGNKCNKNTYAILLKNDHATRGKIHKKQSKLGLFKRVERIVYEYSLHHAIDCVPKYPFIWKEHLARLDQEKVSKIETFVNDIINSFLWANKKFATENKRYATYTLVKSLKSINNKKTAKIALDALDGYARNDPDGKFLKPVLNEKKGKLEVRKDKVRELVDKYLAEPCRYYVKELGLNVFIPAHYDLRMLEVEDRYKEDNEAAMEFLQGWSRYHVCDVIIDKLNGLINGVAEAAGKRSS